MIVLVSANGKPAQQLLVTKRTAIRAVQALLGLQDVTPTSVEWLIEDGTWAAADPEGRLYELAGDLKGDGSSAKKAFSVRSVPLAATDLEEDSAWDAAAAASNTDHATSTAAANGRRLHGGLEAACAPASPKQLSEAPAPTNVTPPFPTAVVRPGTASAAASAAAAAVPASPAAPAANGLRHGPCQDEPLSPAASSAVSATTEDRAVADGGGGTTRSSSNGSSATADVLERVSRARLEATLPLLAAGSHIAVVDPRRSVRDATAEALLRALPGVRDASGAVPRAFRPLRLTFDRARPFQAGLDGFWRWVLEGLHAGAPDLFPGTGLPGEASGFEEAFSADRLPAAPPVVLICSEACALAEASSWFVSRFLGTLRDMGNEQHRFFLHAVAMIGGEPLAKVDMEAYMCKTSTSLSSTLESTQQQLRRSSRSSGRSHSGGSTSRRSGSSVLSSKRSPTAAGKPGGSRKHGELARASATSGLSGGSSGRSGASAAAAVASAAAVPAAASPAGVRRAVSGSSAMGPVTARSGHGDGRLETLHSGGSGGEQQLERHRRRSADGGSLAAAEAAVLAARLRKHEDFFSRSSMGSVRSSVVGGGGGGTGAAATTPEALPPLQPHSPGAKPLSDKVRRLAAAFTRGEPNAAGSTAGSIAAGA